MPEKSAFTFHDNFYPKLKVVLEDATISDKTWDRLKLLRQDYNDIVSQCSSDIGLTHLEKMTIETDPDLPPVASKPISFTFKTPYICKDRNRKYIRSRMYQ